MTTPDERTSKTLILGLGNELRGDDAVGILAVRELRRQLGQRKDLVFMEASVAGMALLDLLQGFQSLILVDAIKTGEGEPGAISRLSEDDFPEDGSLWSAHRMSLRTVLETGRRYGCPVPERVVIYAVEVSETQTWRRGCTPGVQQAIPAVVDQILKEQFPVGEEI